MSELSKFTFSIKRSILLLIQPAPAFFSLPIHLQIVTPEPASGSALVLDCVVLQPFYATYPAMK